MIILCLYPEPPDDHHQSPSQLQNYMKLPAIRPRRQQSFVKVSREIQLSPQRASLFPYLLLHHTTAPLYRYYKHARVRHPLPSLVASRALDPLLDLVCKRQVTIFSSLSSDSASGTSYSSVSKGGLVLGGGGGC